MNTLTQRLTLTAALLGGALSGCAHSVHLIHTSDFEGAAPYAQSAEVSVKKSRWGALGFITDSDYIEEAYEELLKQCSGRITGLTTKYYTELGFLSWRDVVLIKGTCPSK